MTLRPVCLFLVLTGSCLAQLPPDVKVAWDLASAWSETTPTRQRICIDGLWRWQPADATADAPPADAWGHFKVPGPWPGITDYMQKDSQLVHPHPSWKDVKLGALAAAWYQREVEVPTAWDGRRIALSAEYLNSFATIFVDGKKAGELRFPAGELDLSDTLKPGSKHTLTLLVVAMPLKGVMLSYTDSASAREVKGTVPRRGLCGDVFLVSAPRGPRVGETRVETSVERGEVTFDVPLHGLAADGRYVLRARITDGGNEVAAFASAPIPAADRHRWTAKWKPPKLWDLHTPQNQYDVKVTLEDPAGKPLDESWPQRFGFREFRIAGRDFHLNGTRIWLSAVPFDNAQISAAAASYEGARETMRRLKKIGINFVYTHNYDCNPGSHLSFAEVLRAADDEGMLFAITQPHFSHYDWKPEDADATNGYAPHAAFYAGVAGNHPSVVMYSTSHNATGYADDMNPDMMDGRRDARDRWAQNNAKLALRAEAIVNRLDPTRILYHHAGGALGAVYTSNFYPNFTPVQELSDWFENWSTNGVKPLLLCEYGAPFTWDWTMYRGWYQGKREFGSAKVPWEFCIAEWNAPFLGDAAFAITDMEKANLRWEAAQYKAGKTWHRWDYPTQVGSPNFDDRQRVIATYVKDNWRAHRTHGVSGTSPWEYGAWWRVKPNVDRARKLLRVEWDKLQRPGFSADYVERPMERFDVAFEEADWIATPAAEALIRNNQPTLAYIAGKGDTFTEKGHNFYPGERVEKQLVLINNSRRTLTVDPKWSYEFDRLTVLYGGAFVPPLPTGEQRRLAIPLDLPADAQPGARKLTATARFGDAPEQTDSLTIHVLPRPKRPDGAKLALFDPKGETAELFKSIGLSTRSIDATGVPAPDELLVIGKQALTVDGPAPDLSRIRTGGRVIIFEQSAAVLEKRLGFRVVEHGLRQVFPRIPDHPVLAGLSADHVRDWRGDATNTPPRLAYELRPMHGPTVQWCGIPVTRPWRCGNRGNVASVLIEKPTRGDFRPIVDGGYSLQYAPLMEYREGDGLVVFCQLDVTGRTESDPAAETIVSNLLRHVAAWKPEPQRRAVYVGEAAGAKHLNVPAYDGGELSPDDVLVVGPDAAASLAEHRPAVAKFLDAGGRVVAIGVGPDEAKIVAPNVTMRKAELINAVFAPPAHASPLAGIGPADVHQRAPRPVNLPGDRIPAVERNVVFYPVAPWQLDYQREYNLKRTYRRTSFVVARLLANAGVRDRTPLLDHFAKPPAAADKRWLAGLYHDEPEEWDDPYRFFRW